MDSANRWKTAWALATAAVAVVAGLLLTIIALARRITGQAADIEEAIVGARRNTAPLLGLSSVNATLERVAQAFVGQREAS